MSHFSLHLFSSNQEFPMSTPSPSIEELLADDHHASQELFFKALQASSALMAVSTLAEGEFVLVNDAFIKKTGWSKNEIIGKTSRNLDIFVDFGKRDEIVRRLQTEGSVTNFETEIRTKMGTILKGFFNADTIVLYGAGHLLTVFNDATEILNARDRLAESEEKYRLLAEASPEMIFLVDCEGVVRYVNSAACVAFGADQKNVIGKSLDQLYPPHIAARHHQVVMQVISTGEKIVAELEEEFPTGRCWIDARLSPVRDERGKITGVLGLSQDISRRKKVEAGTIVQRDLGLALSKAPNSEDGLRLCLDAALNVSGADSGGIYLLNHYTGDLTLHCHKNLSPGFINAAAGFSSNSPSTQLANAGKPIYTAFEAMPVPLFDNRDKEGLRAVAVIPFAHEDRVAGCLNVASHSIETFPVDVRIALENVTLQIGNAVGRLLAEEALRESEERFRTVFDQAPFGMAMFMDDYRFFKVNQAFCAMSGYSAEEIALLTFEDITHAQNRTEDALQILRLKQGDIPVLLSQKEFFRKDGSIVLSNLTLSVLRGPGGGFLHFLVMIEDVTDRKKMEEELQRSQRLESLGVLAGGIAHDFNNLLAGFFGYTDLARLSLTHDNPAAEYLANSMAALDRARDLSRQLLTFAKGGSPMKTPLSIKELLRDWCNLALSGSNVRCECAIPNDLSVIEADQHQLAQVISNLLINARQAMPDGGKVTISAENRQVSMDQVVALAPGSYIMITVADEGAGIPDKIVGRIFDPFFTTKEHGSGLGLAISYSIVKRHQGHIEVRSTPGVGTTFSIWLPTSEKRAISTSQSSAPAMVVEEGSRILVMDDEPTVLKMMAAVIKAGGYEVVTATKGEAAVEAFTNAYHSGARFDLVILDLTVVGGMGGEKTLAELKRIDPNLRACVSSGYSENDVLENPAAYGFTAAITKPYRVNELLQIVRTILAR
jgi:PAS domain S-box-containing protein